MKGLNKLIKNIIKEVLIEQYSKNIKDIIINRVPFLKDYKLYNHPRDDKRLEAQRVVFNKNVKLMRGDEILNFDQLNISSEVIYYPHKIDDNTFHHFIIKNKIHPTQPKEMDDLTFRVLLLAFNNLEKKLSYNKELIQPNNQDINQNELNEIINDMNKILFEFEEFSQKHNLNLF